MARVTAGPSRRRLYAVVAAASLAAVLLVLTVVPAAAAAALVPSGPRPAAPATAAPARTVAGTEGPQGLDVQLTSITPSALRAGRPLEIRGRVANVDDHPWRLANVYLVVSPSPLTTETQLAAAADSPPGAYFGDRVTDFGLFTRLGTLRPGTDMAFRLEVPWRRLGVSGAGGVYPAGVQVLASDTDGSRTIAGQARTFVPLSDPADRVPVRLAVVWPLGAPVLRRDDGSYARAGRIGRLTETGGRLRRTVDLGASAGSFPLTVVPDPALLDAAGDVGTGDFGPPGRPAAQVSRANRASRPAEPGVADWLDDTATLVAGSTPWSTLYGEPAPDVVASATLPDRLARAVEAATSGAQRRLLGGAARPLLLPRSGVVSGDDLSGLRGDLGEQAVALAPRMLPGWDALDGSAQQVETPQGSVVVVVADPALAEGGPSPADPDSALQVRQRLLAETVLLSAEAAAAGATTASASFVPPHAWDPGPYWPVSDFFGGLDVGWLEPVTLDDLLAEPATYRARVGLDPGAPGGRPADELVGGALPPGMVDAATRLDRRAGLFAQLVDGGTALRRWYDAAAALGISEAGLRDGLVRQQLTERTATSVRRELRGVRVSGSDFVLLSGTRGRFPLTISNDLERPVTVSVRVIGADGEPLPDTRLSSGPTLDIGPGQRDTVTVETRVGDAGVTSAQAYLVTARGRRFGVPLSFTVRTTVVGTVIWGVLGAAGALLLFAIARRLVRRLRRRRAGGAGVAR